MMPKMRVMPVEPKQQLHQLHQLQQRETKGLPQEDVKQPSQTKRTKQMSIATSEWLQTEQIPTKWIPTHAIKTLHMRFGWVSKSVVHTMRMQPEVLQGTHL